MVEIKAKLKIARSAYKLEVKGRLELPFAARRQARLETKLASGEAVALNLPRGEVLRGGDLVTASDGRVLEVIALPEKLVQAAYADAARLARMAWQLGSAHVPAEIGDGYLRVAADAALAEKLRKSGAALTEVEAPFEPEAALGGAHAHGHGHHDHDQHDHDHHHHSHDHKH